MKRADALGVERRQRERNAVANRKAVTISASRDSAAEQPASNQEQDVVWPIRISRPGGTNVFTTAQRPCVLPE